MLYKQKEKGSKREGVWYFYTLIYRGVHICTYVYMDTIILSGVGKHKFTLYNNMLG